MPRPRTRLPIHAIRAGEGWCEDPADRNYNRLVKLHRRQASTVSAVTDPLYDLVLVLGYNDRPRVRGRGSAIFVHLARPGYSPTDGCIALVAARPPYAACPAAARLGDCGCQITSSVGITHAEDRRANADIGRAKGDSLSEITAHAHAQLLQPKPRGDLGEQRKMQAGSSSSGGMHIRPSMARPSHPGIGRQRRPSRPGRTPAFCGLLAGIDLY